MIRNPMPVIPEEEYGRRWEAVQDLMGRLDLDLILAYADDRATFGPESDQYALTAGRIADVRILEEFTHPDEDYPYSEIKSLAEIIPDITPEAPRRVGIAGSALMPGEVFSRFKQALDVQWVDVETAVSVLRAVKSPAELEVMRCAYRIAEQGLEAAVATIREGVSEREVAAEAESAMRRAGAEGTGIDTIVASGPNSRPILARSTFRRIRADELVLATVAPRYEGYHGAIGRPVCIASG